jgi:hypothetical protein
MDLRHAGFSGLACLVAVGFAAAVAGCGSSSSGQAGHPATVTVTASRPPPSPSAAPSSQKPAAAAPSNVTTTTATATAPANVNAANAASVVTAYFAALNAHDYQQAWALGGDNLAPSYAQFVAGYADTVEDSVTVLSTSGDSVAVNLATVQSDGTTQQYSGTYTVSGSTITGASISQVAGAPPAVNCGAPSNPFGYTLCPGGQRIVSPAAGVCNYFNCIDNFPNGTGYMVECVDGTYSMSGGKEDACSYHGGVQQPVYSGG